MESPQIEAVMITEPGKPARKVERAIGCFVYGLLIAGFLKYLSLMS